MKRYLCFFVFILAFQLAKSQDIIVTVEGDTIECQITRVTDEFIHFSVIDKSGVLLMRTRLPVSQIQHYEQHDVATQEEQPQEPLDNSQVVMMEEFDPATFRLGINAGYTYQFGGYEEMPDSYKKQVQSLWNFGGDIHYFITDEVGIGGKYNYIFTEADEDFEPPFSTIFGFNSLRDERITFSYIAVSVLYRNFLYDDQIVNYYVAGGVVKYRTDWKGDGLPYYQEGETFGVTLGVIYDILLSENFGVGIGGEVNIAHLTEFDNNGIVVTSDFSLTRFDFTIGIRFLK
ncbi:outer membrane beta-barrel protein [Ekhidna sp.]|uniref:outer membrane beta-barrel protein n=1 Tax=Ekhidna sp. TaxID=2608089 RepID=UPI003CCB9717